VTYPAFYSSPGGAWPGSIWPGEPGPERLPFTIGYLGDDDRVYQQYRDLNTGVTLTVSPGNWYTLIPAAFGLAAAGGIPSVPGDGRWAGYGTWAE
jgi:hypothetical protein